MKTILFADDNRHVRQYCQGALEEEGYRVVLASDGAEAVRLFREALPDLVILDICMPSLNGLETIDRLRSMDSEVPVIFFTSFDEDCLKDRRGRYAVACIEKNEDLTELKAAVFRIFASQRRTGPLHLGLPPGS
jgi:CheY-like chemotaxis protein